MNICYDKVRRKGSLKIGEMPDLQTNLEASPSFPDSFITKTTQLLEVTHFDKFVVENEHEKNYFCNKRHATHDGLNSARLWAHKQLVCRSVLGITTTTYILGRILPIGYVSFLTFVMVSEAERRTQTRLSFECRACYFSALEEVHELCQSPGFRVVITEL